MKRLSVIQWSLLGLGVFAWGATAASLKKTGELESEPNVLTLKGSPFGRTVAVAMRGPVDVYWNQGESHSHDGHECSGAGCAHQEHEAGETPAKSASTADLLNGVRNTAEEVSLLPADDSLRSHLLDRIDEWKTAYYTRTNPFGSSRVHKAYIMGETEKRLRLSYEMDPSNFSAYGSYYLFLSEALSSLREEGEADVRQRQAAEAALRLSSHTVRYCLARRDEPGALLTAAAAAHDYLQTRYQQGGAEVMAEVNQFLRVQYECLREYETVRANMMAAGTWERMPALRRQEMEVHEYLLNKLHEVNLEMIGRNSVSEKKVKETPRKTS